MVKRDRVIAFLVLVVVLAFCYSNCSQTNSIQNNNPSSAQNNSPSNCDIIVYGGTPSGIMAAIQGSRLGKNVILIEPTHWIGGMVAGGLSITDIGTWEVIGGLALEFFQNTTTFEKSRQGTPIFSNNVIFYVEPHIAAQVFTTMLSQAQVSILTDLPVASVQKNGTQIQQITLTNGKIYSAKVFIDASYEGDLMAMAGTHYTLGREAVSSAEPDAGVQVPLKVSTGVNPYLTPTDPTSGLIFQVTNQPNPPPSPGSADNQHVMAYGYRFCATDFATHKSNAISFSQWMPPGYSESNYVGVARLNALLLKNGDTGEEVARHYIDPPGTAANPEIFQPYADGKMDVNGGTAFDTDVVQISDQYPNGNWTVRQQVAQQIRNYDQGLFYYLATSPNVQSSVQNFINEYGACLDEFTDNNNLPTQLYIREGRRMQGAYIMTEADVLGKVTAPEDVIGLGGYNMDSHTHQLLNINGVIYTEGNSQALIGYGCTAQQFPKCKIAPGKPFLIPYRALTPESSDVTNLLVSVTMSATGTAYRAIRLEPQYMIMGQAAGAAAALAIDGGVTVQNVGYTQLKNLLLKPTMMTQPPQVLSNPL